MTNKTNSSVLFIIDPQNDFMDKPGCPGSLAVPGSYEDMKRLANHIEMSKPKNIIVSMDTHSFMDIAHHSWWVNCEGETPSPFTIITLEDIITKKWRTVKPNEYSNSVNYLTALENGGKQSLCIWPDHCIKGTWGHEVTDVLAVALAKWEKSTGSTVEYVYKGENPHTEHYSALKAEVVLDTYSELRSDLIAQMGAYDIVEIAGEAKSHCVANTVYDLIAQFNATAVSSNVHIIANCMSSVTGFEGLSETFDTWISKQSNMKVVAV